MSNPALLFNGANYAKANSTIAHGSNNSWAIEFNFRLDAFNGSGYSTILGGNPALNIWLTPTYVLLYQIPSFGAAWQTSFNWTLIIGKPYHAAIQFTFNNGYLRPSTPDVISFTVYDTTGAAVFSQSQNVSYASSPNIHVVDYSGVGYLANAGSTWPTRTYKGELQDFRIWNCNLSSTTIASWLFKLIDNTHPNYANLFLNYRTDEGTGTVLHDTGSGTNNGTLYGSPLPSWIVGDYVPPVTPPGGSAESRSSGTAARSTAGSRSSGTAGRSTARSVGGTGSGAAIPQHGGKAAEGNRMTRSIDGTPWSAIIDKTN